MNNLSQLLRWFGPNYSDVSTNLRSFLGWRGNIIGGHTARDHIHSIAGGKFYAGPSDAQNLLHALWELGYIKPTKFQPRVNGTEMALSLMYNSRYVNSVLPRAPVPGTEDSWCWEVVVEI